MALAEDLTDASEPAHRPSELRYARPRESWCHLADGAPAPRGPTRRDRFGLACRLGAAGASSRTWPLHSPRATCAVSLAAPNDGGTANAGGERASSFLFVGHPSGTAA